MAELMVPQTNFLEIMQGVNQLKNSELQRNALEQQNKYQAEDRNYLQKQRGWEEEDRARALKQNQFKDEADALEYVAKSAPFITAENYPASRQHLIELGLNENMLPPPESFQTPEQFEEWKGQALFSIDKYKAETARLKNESDMAEKASKAPESRQIQRGREVVTQEWNKADKKWVDVATGQKDKPGDGLYVELPDGTVVSTGGKPMGQELTKPMQTDVQKKLLEANEQKASLKNTLSQYDDKYLKTPDKLKYLTTSLKEKFDLGTVTDQEKKELSEYTDFRRGAISSLNQYINKLTGAAMGVQEAKRLRRAMPDPGDGPFSGDSPTEFKSKMDSVMRDTDRAIARQNYVNKRGLKSFEDIGLDKVDGLIDERGDEIEASLRQQYPDKSDKEIEAMAIGALTEEFGIQF